MTDRGGAQGTILGVVPLGQGRVILDGTARTPGGWKSYDWGRLVADARDPQQSLPLATAPLH